VTPPASHPAPRRKWLWPLVGASSLVLLAAVYLLVWLFTREPPNYAEVEPGLYVGGRVESPPWFTHATLNLCESEDTFRSPVHEWHPIRDAEPAPSLEWLADRVAFVNEHRSHNRVVYVHCMNGVSRSVMVVTAYLMQKHGSSRDEALAFVRLRRPLARPNPAFMELLTEWERRLAKGRG
jgi:Dual specificity phosphatase, catalytic domain